MERLVALEKDGRTEIVIHVNKLKEGWDVTNLYTIVPLRASASDILTEQTLGRGLRLPYGTRVTRTDDEEFAAIDRLTVIAHDRFDEIIKKAREPGSIVMKQIIIGEGGDVSAAGASLVESPSIAQMLITGVGPAIGGVAAPAAPAFNFQTAEESRAAEVSSGAGPSLEAPGEQRCDEITKSTGALILCCRIAARSSCANCDLRNPVPDPAKRSLL